MASPWIDTVRLKRQLTRFFSGNKSDIEDFGRTVNQTFEAFVYASVVNWYASRRWKIEFKHPQAGTSYVKLKYNTRGRPGLYTYAICTKGRQRIQIRHSIRVATKHHRPGQRYSANIVLDVAVISDHDLSEYKTDDFVENAKLITFGEAKHMSAFAELIANFIGLVHELIPNALIRVTSSTARSKRRKHPAPFLYVSGYLYPTARGLVETIKHRGYDIEVHDHESGPVFGIRLSSASSARS